jgi:homocysteine S-methyltransferase
MPAPLSRVIERPMVTDGGLETDLIFHAGVELPEFAAFPLLEDAGGVDVLQRYYAAYADIARRSQAGLLLESGTWRANPDWGQRLGYGVSDLARVNAGAIAMLSGLRDTYAACIADIVVSGTVGPRGEGYRPDRRVHAADAAAYHRPQLEAFAEAGADIASAYTLTDIGEAIGIVRAAREVGLPVAISFTVETDGRLASGDTLEAAIATVDTAGGPDYYLLNCAHPTHVERGLGEPGAWRDRISGLRCNASLRSHAELDEAEELDEGDPTSFGAAHDRLVANLPRVSIVGGCCGTDARHVASFWARHAAATDA